MGTDRLVDYLTFMILTTWDLHKEPEAGNDQLLEVVCDVQPADLMAFMSRLMAGKRDDDAAEVSGSIVIQLFGILSLLRFVSISKEYSQCRSMTLAYRNTSPGRPGMSPMVWLAPTPLTLR